MASPQSENATSAAVADDRPPAPAQETPAPPETPTKPPTADRPPRMPATPAKVTFKEPARTPRARKKVPWKGKNIVVLVPEDHSRGQPGKAPIPLTAEQTSKMFRSWEELGYNIRGFDLHDNGSSTDDNSQSRADWPAAADLIAERSSGQYQVTLPDLNAWKNYVDELNEAKLRALGVSFGDEDEPAPTSISPAASAPSRQASAQYPTLPFSPPLPTSSASSNPAHGFPFPAPFVPGAQSTVSAQSPAIPSGVSPVSFTGAPGKFNPRQSISIPMGQSPFQPGHQPSPSLSGWPMPHHAGRTDSPGLLNGIISPMSPFMPEGFQPPGNPTVNMHQRHQSLQYPILPHQQFTHQPSARASPRLQEVQEVDEETIGMTPSKTPEHPQEKNTNDDLQAEIDEAEYHLEEQMRNELEHADYSPHHTNRNPDDSDPAQIPTASEKSSLPHSREASSVQFQAPLHFANTIGDGPVLHHPRPHSRGHSLTKKTFFNDEPRHGAGDGSMNHFSAWQDMDPQKADDVAEIETNPSNLGTPVQDFNIAALLQQHQHSFSTTSNPWDEPAPRMSSPGSHHRPNHGSKSSISKLNVNAPEFKFNPANEFEPSGHFAFGNNNTDIDVVSSHEPAVFQATADPFVPPVAPPPPFAFGSSQMSADVPSFTAGHSDFSFTSSGPKFRPDAPSFTPVGAVSGSFASPPASGSEADKTRPNSIFGNLNLSEMVKPAKKSKAIPIIRPSSSDNKSPQKTPADDNGADEESRVKRAKASRGDEDSVPRFADPTPSPPPATMKPVPSLSQEDLAASATRSTDEEGATADTTMSSAVSEHLADSKVVTATSPSDASQSLSQMKRPPFEFESNRDARDVNDARPFGEDRLKRGHKKSLSATARAFFPGAIWANHQEPEQEQEDRQERDDTAEPPTHQGPAMPEQPSPLPQAAPTAVRQPSPVPEVRSVPPAPKGAFRKGLGSSRFASPPPKPKGLMASRFASPSPEPEDENNQEAEETTEAPAQTATPEPGEVDQDIASAHEPSEGPAPDAADEATTTDEHREPTFEEIDDIMYQIEANDPNKGVNRTSAEEPQWQMSVAAVTNSSPYHLQPDTQFRSDAPSPTPRKYQPLPDLGELRPSTELDDPFVDPPRSARPFDPLIYHLNGSEDAANSDWDGTFSEDQQEKLEKRVQFFDGRVNAQVSEILNTRLQPIEKTLALLERHLARAVSISGRERRSASLDYQESDADDEDEGEEPMMHRSISPRRDRRIEQVRSIVNDALQTHLKNTPPAPAPPVAATPDTAVLSALDDLKTHLDASSRPEFPTGEDFRNLVAEVIESRMPPADKQKEMNDKLSQLQNKIVDLEERLQDERDRTEQERTARRDAEELAAELNKKLQAAETRVEVEIMNRSIYDQRVGDVEDRLKQQETQTEKEIAARRAAEDRLSEVQRLLRLAGEEEDRLRDAVEERNQKIKSMEQSTAKSTMRMSLLEAAQNNSTQSQTEFTNRINVLENDLRAARDEANRHKTEAERASETAQRHLADLNSVREESTQQQRFLDTLGTQLQENERVRESWRAKFLSLQDEMTKAAREITEENARRTKREQALVARQEVLDARLQAEARTRERLETEIERLETGERQGLRAVSECRRLEGLLAEMRTENHQLQQSALRYQREFEEARESGASEVERTRKALQFEIDQANNQVNVVRRDLEEHISKLQADLDQANLEIESAKARADMLVEEAQSSKQSEVARLMEKHQNEIEDLQTRHAMQLGNTIEEAQKAEQHLLERLSLSTSKTDHLQDRVAHLEEKLELAKEAALAAAKRARSQSQVPPTEPTQSSSGPGPVRSALATEKANGGVPEKISPQALRESIMVLQEQLQAREQRIEELEHTVEKLDPEATSKIAKRDDEITWLRELLAVRQSDLQDIIQALSTEDYNKDAVRDAAIRLKANLQMEEQERERAMNGNSAINLLQAASPRVAQAVGPLAAAWGNWRKSQQQSGRTGSFGSLTGALSSPASAPGGRNDSTPSKSTGSQSSGALLGGLLTPPASGIRQSLPSNAGGSQPTAFHATGRRLTSQDLAKGARGPPSTGVGHAEAHPQQDETTPPRRSSRGHPHTPPMMRPSAYDSDANPHDFDENDFFQED